ASLARLPPVAVRALEDRVPPERLYALEVGHLVDHPRLQQHAPRADDASTEGAARARDGVDLDVSKGYVRVLRDLRARLASKVRRRDAVAAHHIVYLTPRRGRPPRPD